LRGRHTLRLCVGQTHTELEHVRAAWTLLGETAANMKAEAAPA